MSVSCITYFEEEGKYSFFWVIVGEESCWEGVCIESFGIADAFGVAEAYEATLSMVATITAVSNSSKGQVIVEHVYNNIVDYKCSWWGILFDKIDIFLILTEKVDDKRFWFSSDVWDEFFKIGIREHGEDGSKDLLFDDRAVVIWFLDDGGWEVKFVVEDVASIESLPSILFVESL